MFCIGIDPGKQGAIAIIRNGALVELHDMPEDVGRDLYDIISDWSNLTCHTDGCFCVLEKAQAMSRGGKQGVKSMMTYGIGYGEIRAVLKILEIPFQEIPPVKWKKEFSLIKKDKKASVKVARQLFPKGEFIGVKGGIKDGRAEAALLAEYAQRLYGKEKKRGKK